MRNLLRIPSMRWRSSAAASRFPIMRSAWSMTSAGRSASGAKDGWSSAAHPQLPAIFKTRPRHGSCFTTIGSTPEIAAIWPAARSSSLGASRTSSSGPVSTSIRTKSRMRSETLPGFAGEPWPCSALPIRAPARNASSCWLRRMLSRRVRAKRCAPGHGRPRSMLSAWPRMTSCWSSLEPCRRRRAARFGGPQPRSCTSKDISKAVGARCGGRLCDCLWPDWPRVVSG